MYSARVPEISDQPVEFGTSGWLYRSNKLMYDRVTNTLWRQFLGEPVLGKLANSGIRLKKFPVTLTTWGEWRASHPDTTVLSRDTGVYEASFYVPEEDPRAIYHEYFNSPNTMFPVWLESGALATKDQVLGVFIGGVAKAYQVKALRLHPVFNDHLGEIALVVVTDPTSGGARAYLRDYHGRAVRFDEKLGGERGALLLHDASGNDWRVTEEALVLADDPSVTLDRIPTNNAFWFGWYSNHPSSLVYPRPSG